MTSSTSNNLPTAANPGPFGHVQRKNFVFPDNFTQYNHGSFGAFPKVVQDDMLSWHHYAEKDIDRWMRRELRPALADVRARVADLIHCDKDELALVTNTTMGVNTVLRSLSFQPGDKILQLSTGYASVDKTVRYICDTYKGVELIEVPITFPMTDQEIVDKVENAVKAQQQLKDGSRIKLAMVDWISSVPSIVHPVKQLVEMLQGYGILVYVDGAHAIGQAHVDLTDVHPDFLLPTVTSVRGSAVLYVAKRHQDLIHPTSITADYKTGFENEFGWAGTQDYSSLMSIRAALDFRKQLGGEDPIISYTHSLAVEGGKIIAKILGTEGLTPQDHDHQIGNMVNIRLPLKNVNHPKANAQYFMDTLMDRFNAYTPAFKHGEQWYTRVSAQIYLELQDFTRIGEIWKAVIDELNAE
ncbi:MAG: pyridoxal phosphate-dependent transferase [Benniella sp.]|nr:MAG: pyridoxal phosphate-dependent transferase [Benniella sp.]